MTFQASHSNRTRAAGAPVGRWISRLALGGLLLASDCKFYGDVPTCDEFPLKEGDRFRVTVVEALPQSHPSQGEPCVPVEPGDEFEVTVGGYDRR